ncbi:hypothetical protein HOV04_gp69 [Xanthomonas phage XcP1]|uniref:Uncharacterized protein n=1 Tax=Xanthomonas phage XcP1 TaxID=2785027 RepID=A0A3S7L8K1_9CAUD|nr:hypothetical protein HOV04_gp69 [Xanthomonas phage XcP1]AWN08571.1 hypothetical protein XcP1_069 [Xanthomonas phage XcP1]
MAKKATINKRGNVSIAITNKSICMEKKDAPKFEFQTEFPEFKESEHRGIFTVHFLPINMRSGQRRGITLICFLDSNAKPQFRVPTRIYGSARDKSYSITSLNSHQMKAYGKLVGVSYAKLKDAAAEICHVSYHNSELDEINHMINMLTSKGFVVDAKKSSGKPAAEKPGIIATPLKRIL